MAREATAKKEKPTIAEMGGNIQPVKDDLVKFRDEVLRLKSKRNEINADIKAIMEKAESLGIPKKSLRWALNYWESSPEQRDGLHEGYTLCLESWGMPVTAFQSEMWGGAGGE